VKNGTTARIHLLPEHTEASPSTPLALHQQYSGAPLKGDFLAAFTLDQSEIDLFPIHWQ
jgi:hypothetical protein